MAVTAQAVCDSSEVADYCKRGWRVCDSFDEECLGTAYDEVAMQSDEHGRIVYPHFNINRHYPDNSVCRDGFHLVARQIVVKKRRFLMARDESDVIAEIAKEHEDLLEQMRKLKGEMSETSWKLTHALGEKERLQKQLDEAKNNEQAALQKHAAVCVSLDAERKDTKAKQKVIDKLKEAIGKREYEKIIEGT